jgi:hypothetical protein
MLGIAGVTAIETNVGGGGGGCANTKVAEARHASRAAKTFREVCARNATERLNTLYSPIGTKQTQLLLVKPRRAAQVAAELFSSRVFHRVNVQIFAACTPAGAGTTGARF